jgi:hypothetical protein
MILVRLAGGSGTWLLCSTSTLPVSASISRYELAATSGGGGMTGVAAHPVGAASASHSAAVRTSLPYVETFAIADHSSRIRGSSKLAATIISLSRCASGLPATGPTRTRYRASSDTRTT